MTTKELQAQINETKNERNRRMKLATAEAWARIVEKWHEQDARRLQAAENAEASQAEQEQARLDALRA